ncbi:MAG: ABC transporter ATP-binding protein [Ruminococcaceae bacterium]|nr:ABC transporter ATP-binding protein [Oscillospiraceae bacterium]
MNKHRKNPNTLTIKESRAIIKSNLREMKRLEQLKRAKLTPDQFTTVMKSPDNILEIDNLETCFFTDNGVVRSVNKISFDVPKDSIIGLVGESGCGKSVTSLSIMQLVQAPQGQVVGGEIRFQSDELGKDEQGRSRCYNIVKMPTQDMCRIRGKDISMIFQEPMTSLNPVFTVGYQIEEVYLLHTPNATKEDARRKAIEMLSLVGIPMPETIVDYYPHQLSGGMRQRVMIAIALTGNPKLIIADEPTTALDVTIQSQILKLLKKVQKDCGASVMLITHDLGVVAEMADYVVVMYAGKIVEKGTVYEIFDNPLHPYTIGIQKAKPSLDSNASGELYSIPGNVPNPINIPNECLFKGRCDKRCGKCAGEYPKEIKITETHSVFCHLYDNEKGE